MELTQADEITVNQNQRLHHIRGVMLPLAAQAALNHLAWHIIRGVFLQAEFLSCQEPLC